MRKFSTITVLLSTTGKLIFQGVESIMVTPAILTHTHTHTQASTHAHKHTHIHIFIHAYENRASAETHPPAHLPTFLKINLHASRRHKHRFSQPFLCPRIHPYTRMQSAGSSTQLGQDSMIDLAGLFLCVRALRMFVKAYNRSASICIN
jgi:hypothetical protein